LNGFKNFGTDNGSGQSPNLDLSGVRVPSWRDVGTVTFQKMRRVAVFGETPLYKVTPVILYGAVSPDFGHPTRVCILGLKSSYTGLYSQTPVIPHMVVFPFCRHAPFYNQACVQRFTSKGSHMLLREDCSAWHGRYIELKSRAPSRWDRKSMHATRGNSFTRDPLQGYKLTETGA